MRTTLTLDPDVEQQLERLRAERGEGLKALVNEALRIGLAELDAPTEREPFRTKAVKLRPKTTSVDDVAEVLALAEGEDFR